MRRSGLFSLIGTGLVGLASLAGCEKSEGNNHSVDVDHLYRDSVRTEDVDYNGDGYVDRIMCAVAGFDRDLVLLLYSNDGRGNLELANRDDKNQRTGIKKLHRNSLNLSAGDYDNDGDVDFRISGVLAGGGSLLLDYENDGEGNFTLRKSK